MSESSVSVSSPEEDIVISSSSSSRSGRVSSSSDVKDQAEDEANPRPWYTADEKSSKMSTEDLVELLQEYPLPVGWYAHLPGLQEPANYGTKYETGIYEEQVRSGYRLPLHPFALRFFEHYHMAPGQLVPNGWRKLVGLIYLVQTSGYKPDTTDFMRVFFESVSPRGLPIVQDSTIFTDFENPGKPAPNNLTKHILSHIKLQSGLFIDEPLSEQQLEWARIIPRTLVPAGAVTPPPAPTISSTFPAESASLESQREKERKVAKCRVAPCSKEDKGYSSRPISADRGEVLPQDKEIFQNQTHETFACSFAQAVYTMYASGSEMLSRFEMARQVAAEEAQQKRDAIKEVQEATHRAKELSNQEEDYLAKITTLEKRLERIKRKAAKEVTKARDQGIRDFLDGNAGDEWLKKQTEDGLEIYDLGFTKAKETFVERFPDIPLEDFVLPAVASPSREIAMLQRRGMSQLLILRGKVRLVMHPSPRF
ncbi:hypothetical protein RJ639_009593 [Escallonia herrerae]|uniref:Transposase (putative) gypsy type domain-containing protein n=1 Tax=Escallonia herrerae TaxID=1293975 RepID=A0AA88VQL6_9ASTE|nr:hypothetical protein RJ639_009593 [Escallonia herrerae]